MKINKNSTQIGIKTKGSVIFIFGYIMFLTWLIIVANLNIATQTICLIMTIVASYVLLVIAQDYFFLKNHKVCSKFRKDLNLIRPLFSERKKVK